jgi:hypothetical protein
MKKEIKNAECLGLIAKLEKLKKIKRTETVEVYLTNNF